MTSSTEQQERELRERANQIIVQAKQGCVDRGVDPISGKRGKCHVFLNDSDICQCEDKIDLSKERMK